MWSDFLRFKWHLLYSKLVYRPLEHERSEEMLHTLEEFIQEVRGKKFKLSASKLLGKHRESASEEGYFCSELLATAFKRCGLLAQDMAASRYWPGHFSTEKKIELVGEARLGEELLIDFEAENLLA